MTTKVKAKVPEVKAPRARSRKTIKVRNGRAKAQPLEQVSLVCPRSMCHAFWPKTVDGYALRDQHAKDCERVTQARTRQKEIQQLLRDQAAEEAEDRLVH